MGYDRQLFKDGDHVQVTIREQRVGIPSDLSASAVGMNTNLELSYTLIFGRSSTRVSRVGTI